MSDPFISPPGWDPMAIPSPVGSKHRAYQDGRAAYFHALSQVRAHPAVKLARLAVLEALRGYRDALSTAETEVNFEAIARASGDASDDYFGIPVSERWYNKQKTGGAA